MTNQKKKRGPPPKGSRPTPQRTSPAFVTPMAAQAVKRLPEGDDSPMKVFSEYLMVDPTDREYFLPLIQYRAEQGPPRKAIFLKFDDMLAVLRTVAGHRKSCCFHKPLYLRNRT